MRALRENRKVFVMENEKTEIISAKYITEQTDHMEYQPGMDNIGSEVQDEVIFRMNAYDADAYTAADVLRALRKDVLSPEMLPVLLKRVSYGSLDDMYAAIGYGGFTAQKAVSRIQGELNRVAKLHQAEKAAEELAEAKPAEPAKQPSAPKRVKSEQGIIVEGLDNCLVKFSKCCTPVPGDDIIGFITRGYGVSVHRCDCPNASEEKRSQPGQEGRWIKVSWGGDTNDSYPTILEVVCKDRQGLLLDISAALSTTNTFVLGINSRSTEDQFAIFRLEIRVKDGAQLKSVMNKLNQISGVLKVNRPAG